MYTTHISGRFEHFPHGRPNLSKPGIRERSRSRDRL